MASPQSQTVVIVCPHCATRYQVPSDTIGAEGRQVACAHCGKAWTAHALDVSPPPPKPKLVQAPAPAASPVEPDDDDMLFDSTAEAELDAVFAAEQKAVAEAKSASELATAALSTILAPPSEPVRSIEEIKAAIAPKPSAAPPRVNNPEKTRQQQKAFSLRQDSLIRQLPLARVRRTMRMVGLICLVLLIGCGFTFRTQIVRAFPDLAGAYAALGLGVNIVGLEFRDVKTLVSLRKGAEVMQVDARIYSVAAGTVPVPPVLVTLLNAENLPLYEWSVTPDVRELTPGEIIDLTTQVTSPPPGATRIRLTFTNGRAPADLPTATAAEPSTH